MEPSEQESESAARKIQQHMIKQAEENIKGVVDDEEEEDGDLFEINLEIVNKIPPPQYYWESYFTATSNALLANCLLPVADVSCAVPMMSTASDELMLAWTGIREDQPASFQAALKVQFKEMKV